MPDLNLYRKSASYAVSRNLYGGFDVVVSEYEYGNLVRTNTYTFDNESGEIVGILERQYPDIYNTIIDVNEANLPSSLLDVTSVGGLKLFCANCSNLVHVNVASFVYPESGPYHNEYGFYNCSQLYMFRCMDIFNRADEHYSAHMFEGCSSLRTLGAGAEVGSSDEIPAIISFVNSLRNCKDMFKGCTNLAGLKIKNGTGDNDIMAEQVIDSVTYEHGYEFLGLTADQFEIVTE